MIVSALVAFPGRPSCRLLLSCVALLAAFASTSAREPLAGVSDRWRQLALPGVELYSQVNEREARLLLRHFLAIDAVMRDDFGLRDRQPVELLVLFFTQAADLASYVPGNSRRDHISFHMGAPDRGVFGVTAAFGSDGARQAMQGSYARAQLSRSQELQPDWLRWGLGYLLGTLELKGADIVYGAPDAYRSVQVKKRREFSCAWVFPVRPRFRDQEEVDIFHAHAWALLHYLLAAETDIPRARAQEFLRFAAERGVQLTPEQFAAGFERILGFGYAEMDRRMTQYLRAGRFVTRRFSGADTGAADQVPLRAVGRDEIRLRLAEFAVKCGEHPAAKFVLLDAAGRRPADPRVLETLGTLSLREGDDRRMRERWEQALEEGGTNAAVAHRLAVEECRRWFGHFDPHFRLTPETAARLRAHLLRSIERTPGQSVAYEILAWVEAAAPEPSLREVQRVQENFERLTDRSGTYFALAWVRARVGDFAACEEMLDFIIRSDASPEMGRKVRSLRTHVERQRGLTERP